MFKRVEKRRRRHEEEEELGLDSDMKEVLGLQDTDSDESESSSDDEESGGEAGGSRSAESSGEADEEDVAALLDDENEESDENEIPPMSVTEAVRDPVYLVSMDPEIKACILCPGKALKNTVMAEVHKASKAHNRRFTRFVELVQEAGPDASVGDLIRAVSSKVEKKADAVPSKRAEKRKEKIDAIRAKRTKRKEKLKKANEKRKAEAEVETETETVHTGPSDDRTKAKTQPLASESKTKPQPPLSDDKPKPKSQPPPSDDKTVTKPQNLSSDDKTEAKAHSLLSGQRPKKRRKISKFKGKKRAETLEQTQSRTDVPTQEGQSTEPVKQDNKIAKVVMQDKPTFKDSQLTSEGTTRKAKLKAVKRSNAVRATP